MHCDARGVPTSAQSKFRFAPSCAVIVIKFGKLKLYNNILSQDLEANKTIRFLSKDIKQYIQGNKLHLKGNKILGLLIFLLVSRSPQNIRPMR